MSAFLLQVERHHDIFKVLRHNVHHIWWIIAGLTDANNRVAPFLTYKRNDFFQLRSGQFTSPRGERYAFAMFHFVRSVAQLVKKKTTVRQTMRMRG
jgi:hypothetical protein